MLEMLTFFVPLYPDELVYSAVARYHYYVGNLDLKDTLEEVFASRNVIPSVGISAHLEALVRQIGGGYSVQEMLYKHTTFPFYAPFLSQEKKQRLILDATGSGPGLYSRLGAVAGGICRKEALYYCPGCVLDDVELYGETYIHRQHQLEGIHYCGKHLLELRKYPVTKSGASRIALVRFDQRLMDMSFNTIKTPDVNTKIELDLAVMAEQLMRLSTDQLELKDLRKKYKSLLRERNVLNASMSIRQEDLYQMFISNVSPTLLKKLESEVDNKYEYNWLRVLTRNSKRHVHPLRHLLFIHFLGQDIDKLSKFKYVEGDFGQGPWPCLNKAAAHYYEDVITEVRVSRDSKTGSAIGTFTCSCGFVYARRGPDKHVSDRYRIGRVKSYGSIWLQTLKQLHAKTMSIRAISRKLGVDSKTVLKYLDVKQTERSTIHEAGQCSYIAQKLLVEKTIIKYKLTKVQGTSQVNWNERDKDYCVKVKMLHSQLIKQLPPIRITKTNLAMRLGKVAMFQRKLDRLPKTQQLLSELTETFQQFQLRRCKKFIDQMVFQQKSVPLWKIQRLAAVKSHHFKQLKPLLTEYVHMKQGRCNDEYENH